MSYLIFSIIVTTRNYKTLRITSQRHRRRRRHHHHHQQQQQQQRKAISGRSIYALQILVLLSEVLD